jgi:hypothetical protein
VQANALRIAEKATMIAIHPLLQKGNRLMHFHRDDEAGIVLSHPCANKKARGWGTGNFTLFVKAL